MKKVIKNDREKANAGAATTKHKQIRFKNGAYTLNMIYKCSTGNQKVGAKQ
jgi:hypothetical protein